jgi:hypothetical protein
MLVQMLPSPCRLVLYHFVSDPTQPIVSRPALITSILVDGRVNLHVFFEPTDAEHGLGTSCALFDNYRLGISERAYENKHPGTWSWPPRAPLPGV